MLLYTPSILRLPGVATLAQYIALLIKRLTAPLHFTHKVTTLRGFVKTDAVYVRGHIN